MHVVVVGGTGKIGRQVVRRAVELGHQVTAVARHQVPTVNGETLVTGDVLAAGSWSEVLPGADVVVFAAGSRGTSSTVVRSDGIANVLTAMGESPVARVVAIAPANVAISPNLPITRRLLLRLIVHKRLRNVLNDVERLEDELLQSKLDWTVVRASGVQDNTSSKYTVSVGGQERTHRPVATAALADYVLSQALTPELSRSVVTLTGQR